MKSASELPRRYNIGKTSFYKRRDFLIGLGYNLEATKEGRNSFYSDEQVNLFDSFDDYISENGTSDGFPAANSSAKTSDNTTILTDESQDLTSVNQQNGHHNGFVQQDLTTNVPTNGELVVTSSELVTSPNNNNDFELDNNEITLVDNSEQNFQNLDTNAQYAAAGELTAFNYLKQFYLKTRNFTVDGLSQEVEQSEQAVRQVFDDLRTASEQTIKKMMQKVKQRDKPQ